LIPYCLIGDILGKGGMILGEKILKNSSKYETNLKSIYDLERILRRIKLHKLHPLELTYLATSLNSILTILKESKEDKINFDVKLMEGIEELKGYLYNRFNLEMCARFKIEQIDSNIFREGIYPDIDNILELQNRELSKLIGHYEYRELEGSELWLERDANYRTKKNDPGKKFMRAVRAEVRDLNLTK